MTQRWFGRNQKRQRKGVQDGGETRFKHSGTEKQTGSRTGHHREKKKKKAREARWFGYVQRRDLECMGRRLLRLEVPGRRLRGRPKRRLVEVGKEHMRLVGAKAEDRLRYNNNRNLLI